MQSDVRHNGRGEDGMKRTENGTDGRDRMRRKEERDVENTGMKIKERKID